jgi:Xaa-Pro aminopeptidase
MRKCGLLFAMAAACVWAGDAIPRDEYQARRAELRKKLEGALVLFGWNEGHDEVYRTPQGSNFMYLTGWTEPGAVLLLTPAEEKFFLPKRNARSEIYNGKRSAPGDPDVQHATGFRTVLPMERLESSIRAAMDENLALYAQGTAEQLARLKTLVALRDIGNPQASIAELRMKKSRAEIEAIRRATEVSMEAHLASWKRLQPGTYEYQAAATFTERLLEAGCDGHAYHPIFGSGPNGVILHYSANSRRMDAGEVIVIDAGGRCGGYTSDITRTLPIGGKFTERQRELYNVVLGAQQAVIDAIKPGLEWSELTKIARSYMDKHGKDKNGVPLGKYLLHGVSHHVGLDVHDPGKPDIKLEAGMVLTVEPGLYIKEENIGIRIEDVILVTESGASVLSGALPRGPDEVEKALAQ